MKAVKNIFRLLLPPILNIFYLLKAFNKLKIFFYGQKFQLEKNFYSRHAFILRSIFVRGIENCQYLEIGVRDNNVFNTIPLRFNQKIGVDPEKGGTHRITSDKFFISNKKNFDVIFIDGLHTYEQCQRDCINSMNILKNNGIILFHDFLPNNIMQEEINFSGDVWKIAVELSNSKNVEFKIANIDCGVGILKLKKNWEYLKIPELSKLAFKDFYKDYYPKLPIVNSEEAFNFIDKI
jgi:hypothetical protein